MAKVTIQGKEYELRLDLDALEKVADEFGGGMATAMNAFKTSNTRAIRKLVAILANSARHHKGEPEDIDPEDFRHITLSDLDKIGKALREAEKESMETETIGGAADDEHRNMTLERIEAEDAKNGEPGER